MRNRLLIILAFLYPLPAYATSIKVVASFSIIGDMVHEITGDTVELKTLVSPDADAHTYQPTPADVKAITTADLVIINGLGFEGWMERLSLASGKQAKIIIASKGIRPLEIQDSHDDHIHSLDPHAWQDLGNAKIYATNIRDALIQADQQNAVIYTRNTARYLKEIEALDTWTKTQISSIPKDKRKVVSSHDAFGYFSRAYGVEFIALQSTNTESQPSAADIAKLIDLLRKENVRAIFAENISDPRLLQQLEKDANARIGGTLYSDALSNTQEANHYLTMFRHNVTQLVTGMSQ